MATATLPEETHRRIERFLTDWLTEYRIPGAGVAIVKDGEVVFGEGFGARDLASNAPATPDTRYGVASITKSFTALAVLQLVEAGEVALDAPVTEYVDFYDTLEEPPTVHELLSHASGMPSDGASVALISRAIGGDPEEVPLSSDADLERFVRDAGPERASGERFFYYNTGYTVLGRLVAAVDGRDFPTYVGQEILDPLGMERSVVAPPDFAELDDAMTPYWEEDGERVAAEFPVKGVGAAGGLVSTAADLATYITFQFDPDPGVVDPALLDRARERHVTRQAYIDGTEQGYGYGWMRRPFLDDDLVEHGGALGVSTAYVGFLEKEQIGVALACNDSPEAHPSHVGRALLAIMQDRDPASATEFFGLREKAERVAGEYESYRGIQQMTVERDGSGLTITAENVLEEQTISALPETADPDDLQYYTVDEGGVRVPIRFEQTEDGLDMFYRRWRLHQT